MRDNGVSRVRWYFLIDMTRVEMAVLLERLRLTMRQLSALSIIGFRVWWPDRAIDNSIPAFPSA